MPGAPQDPPLLVPGDNAVWTVVKRPAINDSTRESSGTDWRSTSARSIFEVKRDVS